MFRLKNLLSIQNKKLKGITLIELILVIGILAILSSIILINSNLISDKLEKRELEQIVISIKNIKHSSISSRREEKITFDFSGNSYKLSNSNETVELKHLKLTKEGSNRDSFYFTKNGRTGFEGAGTIVLTGENETYKIVVTPVTGRVSWRENDEE